MVFCETGNDNKMVLSEFLKIYNMNHTRVQNILIVLKKEVP
jgi:hypothetical protein